MRATASRIALAASGVFAATVIATPGCSLDFDRYEPDAGRSGDGAIAPTLDGSQASDAAGGPGDSATIDVSSGDDAAEDAPEADAPSQCTPSQSCLMQAGTCGGMCNQQYQQCVAQCQNNGCKQGCKQQQTTCYQPCTMACDSCTQSAGCAAPTDCANSVRNGM